MNHSERVLHTKDKRELFKPKDNYDGNKACTRWPQMHFGWQWRVMSAVSSSQKSKVGGKEVKSAACKRWQPGSFHPFTHGRGLLESGISKEQEGLIARSLWRERGEPGGLVASTCAAQGCLCQEGCQLQCLFQFKPCKNQLRSMCNDLVRAWFKV